MSGENLGTLHRYMFGELERLANVDVSKTGEVTAEVDRARAMCQIGGVVVANAKLALEVHERCATTREAPPKMLGVSQE